MHALDLTLADEALLARALGPRITLDAARGLLESAGGIDRIACLEASQLHEHLGKQAAARLCSWLELERRATALSIARADMFIRDSRHVADWASLRLSHLPHEELWLLSLTRGSILRSAQLVARGGRASISIAATEVLRAALSAGGVSFVLVHNHPSGATAPSEEDERFTRQVAQAAHVIGLSLTDHVIVSVGGYYSVSESTPEWLSSS